MLRIIVTQYNGQAPEQPLAAEFDELGGKIGRGTDNTLILPDIHRYISRTHALVFFRAGTYFIRDVGSASPVLVNQRQLGTGQEAPIGDGDEITIAGYSLRVVADQAKTSSAGLLPEQSAVATSGGVKDDPLAAFGGGESRADAFADLIPPAPSARVSGSIPPAPPKAERPLRQPDRGSSSVGAGAPQSPPSRIPDDFDPFAAPMPATAAEARLPDDLDIGFGSTGQSQKIDDLFGLAPGDGRDPFKSETPMAEPFDAGGSSASLDPLVAMGLAPATKPPAAPPQRNDTPELRGSYRMPKANVDGPASTPASPMADAADSARLGRDAVSTAELNSGARDIAARTIPTSERDPPLADAIVSPSQSPELSPAATASDRTSADALLHAFLTGAGVPEVQIPGGMTPQLMHVLGQLFRENTQGTLDLLLARAATKRQLRAEMTTIVARENNPLKFSPTVEGALTHLLAPQGRGFMTPVRALKDAYNDLRSHEVGFLAGMRAALAGVLARFAPAQLEKRLTRKTVLDALLQMNRQAKLWALFEELYADISSEAEDNFHNLFGKEFMRAYEAQITKLEQEERAAKR